MVLRRVIAYSIIIRLLTCKNGKLRERSKRLLVKLPLYRVNESPL